MGADGVVFDVIEDVLVAGNSSLLQAGRGRVPQVLDRLGNLVTRGKQLSYRTADPQLIELVLIWISREGGLHLNRGAGSEQLLYSHRIRQYEAHERVLPQIV